MSKIWSVAVMIMVSLMLSADCRAESGVPAQEPRAFFRHFIDDNPKTRGEFETEDQFQQRMKWNSSSVIYLYAYPDVMTFKEPGYSYDMDSQRLTLSACSRYRYSSRVLGNAYSDQIYPNAIAPERVTILRDEESRGTYQGTNAFGAQVQVTRTNIAYYVLKFSNLQCCPATVLNLKEGRFKFKVSRSPAEAKRLSRDAQIILGVRIADYIHSGTGFVASHEPTFHEPWDNKAFLYQIDAEIVSVMLVDKFSDEILARYDINCPPEKREKVVPTQ